MEVDNSGWDGRRPGLRAHHSVSVDHVTRDLTAVIMRARRSFSEKNSSRAAPIWAMVPLRAVPTCATPRLAESELG